MFELGSLGVSKNCVFLTIFNVFETLHLESIVFPQDFQYSGTSESRKSWFSFDKSRYDEAIKKPITTGKNFNGPSRTSITASSILVVVLITNFDKRFKINLAINLLSK